MMISNTFKIGRFILLAAAVTMLAGAVHAETEVSQPKRKIIPDIISVSLLRQNDKTGEAFLRLRTPVGASGCPRMSELKYKAETDAPVFYVTVEKYTLDFSSVSRNIYKCDTSNQYAIADIPLDRKLIEDNKLEKIRFSLDKGAGTDNYKIIMGKNSLSLLAETEEIFEAAKMPSGGEPALFHWYYPQNTLVLTAPLVPEAQQDQAISDFAAVRGLTKLETLMPEFVMPSGRAHRHYYVDGAGKLITMVPNHDNVAVSDTISARRPGTFE